MRVSFSYGSGIDIRSRNSSGCPCTSHNRCVKDHMQSIDRPRGWRTARHRDLVERLLSRQGGETTVDKLKLLNKYVKEVRDYCFRNPQTSVMQAVETLIERTR